MSSCLQGFKISTCTPTSPVNTKDVPCGVSPIQGGGEFQAPHDAFETTPRLSRTNAMVSTQDVHGFGDVRVEQVWWKLYISRQNSY